MTVSANRYNNHCKQQVATGDFVNSVTLTCHDAKCWLYFHGTKPTQCGSSLILHVRF